MKVLIKLGGTLLDSEETRHRLAGEIALAVRDGVRVVVVHGGGKQMTRFLAERGVESHFINGLRVTTPEVLDAVLKVLAGTVNQQLVAALVAAGVKAVGLSGMDSLLTEARPLSPELGSVGRVVRADGTLFDLLSENGYVPVVACVAGDRQGNFYNVNADQMAAACASSFCATKLLFLTDVDGVRGHRDEVCATLTSAECRRLIESGVATGGMQAKLEAAMTALSSGVSEVTIGAGARQGIVRELISGEPFGTRLVAGELELSTNG